MMRRLEVVIRQVDDDGAVLTDIARFEVPETDLAAVEPETGLDVLEATTQQVGQAILRRLLQAQWEAVDAAAVAAQRRSFPPSGLDVRRIGCGDGG